jgi:hypothetical protein
VESVIITLIVVVLTFVAGYAGLKVQDWLVEHNSVAQSRDMIGSVLGLLTLLLALVLGTLIGNTYYFSTAQQSNLQSMMSTLILADKSLAEFGPEAKPVRDGMKAGLERTYEDVWVKGSVDPDKMTAGATLTGLAPLEKAIDGLDAKTPAQVAAKAAVQGKFQAFLGTRVLMALQLAVPFSKALLGIVIIWAALLFFGYGLLSKHNSTTLVALGFGSICVGFAVFIIVELGEPYSGLFRVSPAALVQAIDAMDR